MDGPVRPLLATFFFLSVVDGRRRLVVAVATVGFAVAAVAGAMVAESMVAAMATAMAAEPAATRAVVAVSEAHLRGQKAAARVPTTVEGRVRPMAAARAAAMSAG